MSLGSRIGAKLLESSHWSVRMLPGAPLIAPARQFVFPRAVPGEEDALARGSVYFEIRPKGEPTFLAQCALGYASPHVASGLWPVPAVDSGKDGSSPECLAIAGGYAYLLTPGNPRETELLAMRPVTEVVSSAEYLLLAGYHDVLVRAADGLTWRSPKLTWEGLTLLSLEGTRLTGAGWDLSTDEEVPFTLDLATQELHGGGYRV